MTASDNVNRAFRPEPGRKYWNHMAKHSPGEWHRHWLLASGQYIKTSNPYMRKGYGWAVIGEPWPELVKLRNRTYPPPHHRGSAADVEHHWPGCGHE